MRCLLPRRPRNRRPMGLPPTLTRLCFRSNNEAPVNHNELPLDACVIPASRP